MWNNFTSYVSFLPSAVSGSALDIGSEFNRWASKHARHSIRAGVGVHGYHSSTSSACSWRWHI